MSRQLTIHSDVAERSRAVILHVCVWRVEQADKDGDGSGINELLPVLVRVRHVEQRASRVTLDTHVLGLGKSGEGDKGA